MNNFIKELQKEYPNTKFEIFKQQYKIILLYSNYSLTNNYNFHEFVAETADLYLNDNIRNSISLCYKYWYNIKKAN